MKEIYSTDGMIVLWYNERGEQKYKIVDPKDCPDKWYRYNNGWTKKMIHCPETKINPPTPFK